MSNDKVETLAISGILTLNAHSLNNEGSEGNTTETRMVEVVDNKGDLHTVNAISGDMFKHIQYMNLVKIAKEENLSLCEGCKIGNPNRINMDEEFGDQNTGNENTEIIDEVLKNCVGDDLEGVMITSLGGSKASVSRKSVVEISWVIGLPEHVETDTHFHVKYDKAKTEAGSGGEEGQNVGQNIFHKPSSSGNYAVVVNIDLNRIGYNDISNEYILDDEEIIKRKKAMLQSVMQSFIEPKGAQRNTSNPHVLDFEGVISTSTSSLPSPSISPLYSSEDSSYVDEIDRIAEALNNGNGEKKVNTIKFDSMGSFVEEMTSIINQME